MNYATLTAVKRILGLQTNSTDDDLLEALLVWATDHIQQYKGRFYAPRIETRLFDIPDRSVSGFGRFADPHLQAAALASAPLRLDENLLEVVEMLNGDGEEISVYLLEPANQWPKTRVRLIDDFWQAQGDGNTRQVISLSGVWGTHDDYVRAWKKSGQAIQDDPLTAEADSITVLSLDPFQAGQLLRLEDEFALITALVTTEIDEQTVYTLTVERGANGSTAAIHSQETVIEIWQVQGNIAQACIRLVKWRYSQKDVDTFDKTYNAEMGMTIIPSAMPTDVKALLGAGRTYTW